MRGGPTRASLPLIAALCLAPSACSDPKAASEANFRGALEPVVADAFCSPLRIGRVVPDGASEAAAFPLIVPVEPFRFDNQPPRGPVLAVLDQAVKAGLLIRTEGETMGRQENMTEPATRRRTLSYAPTESGSGYFRGVAAGTRRGGAYVSPNVCGAKGEIVDVVRWTEPADLLGQKVSQVTYTYRGVDPVSLVTDAERAKVAETQERTVPMVLASDGWRKAPR